MGQFCPHGDIWQHLEMFLGGTGGKALPASGGSRPGMLLGTLWRTEQPCTTKTPPFPSVNSGEIEKSWSGGTGSRGHSREGLPVEGTGGPRLSSSASPWRK